MSSKRDREILNAIVNPLLPVGEGVFDDEENVPQDLKDPPTEDSKETRCTLPDCKNKLTRSKYYHCFLGTLVASKEKQLRKQRPVT